MSTSVCIQGDYNLGYSKVWSYCVRVLCISFNENSTYIYLECSPSSCAKHASVDAADKNIRTRSSNRTHAGNRPAGTEAPPPPGREGSHQAHCLVCRQAVLQTWHALIAAAQEAEGSNPVVNSDHDDSAPVRHLLPVVQGVSQDGHVIGRSQQEGPSKEVNHHRQVAGHCRWGRAREGGTANGVISGHFQNKQPEQL